MVGRWRRYSMVSGPRSLLWSLVPGPFLRGLVLARRTGRVTPARTSTEYPFSHLLRQHTPQSGYIAGGTPLAVTLEDFLVFMQWLASVIKALSFNLCLDRFCLMHSAGFSFAINVWISYNLLIKFVFYICRFVLVNL